MKLLRVLILLMPSVVTPAEVPQDFASGMTIQADGQDALYEIELPAALYRGVTRSDLGDLRVFNGHGEVVPHALRPRVVTVEQAGAAVRLPVFPLYGGSNEKFEDLQVRIEKRADGTIIDIKSGGKKAGERKLRGYLLDASALKSAIQTLHLGWQSASSSFIGHVSVNGSDDLTAWKRLSENAALARLDFAGHQVERNAVELRAARLKYLRLSWPDSQAPLDSLTVRAVPAPSRIAAARLWESVTGVAVADKPDEYSYDLGGYFPFDRLRVELPQVNSLVQLQLFARAKPSDEWRRLLSAVAYRLRQGETEVTSPEITLTTSGERYVLLRVDQKGGGVGSGVPAIQIGWVAQKLVFAARGAGPFQIAYGSATVKPAAFAIESIIPGYKTDVEFKVTPAKLGEQVTLAGSAQLRAPWDYRKVALWGSLIAGVGLLGWMALRLSRQIVKPPADLQKSDEAKELRK